MQNNYLEILKNTIKYNFSDREVREILELLKKDKVITYSKIENDEKKILYVDNSKKLKERLLYAIDEKSLVVKYVERYLLDKVYRYSIYRKCEKFELKKVYEESEKNKYVQFNNIEKLIESNSFDMHKIVIEDSEDKKVFRFLVKIEINLTKEKSYTDIYYPTLWIYHKKLKVFEFRFDAISAETDDEFYAHRMDGQHAKLSLVYDAPIDGFRLSEKIKKIVADNNNVKEVAQAMGLKRNSMAKLKVGTNNVMPLIGDLEELMLKNQDMFKINNETEDIEKLLNDFIEAIKKNAKYKTRTLSWYQDKESILDIQIIFDYKNTGIDLLNFQDPKKLDGRMMDYAVEFITKIEDDVRGK